MGRLLSVFASGVLTGFILGCMAYGQAVPSQSVVSAPAMTPSANGVALTVPGNADSALDPASLLPDLPSLPRTKASLIGGTIRKVDRVRDQLTVQIFGGGKMKIFFDPRTHILAGNSQASAAELHPGDRVYVDTILDGSTVFARDIRLAGNAGGASQGVVISYRADKDELLVRDMLSPDPVKMRLSSRTQVVHDGHAASASQLVPGTLVDVNFASQKDGREAQQVSILAVPGTSFTFAGLVTTLDLHLDLLAITSSTDHKTYEIYLDPSLVTVDDRLHLGADVTTVANFDGSRYVARSLTVNSR